MIPASSLSADVEMYRFLAHMAIAEGKDIRRVTGRVSAKKLHDVKFFHHSWQISRRKLWASARGEN